MSLAQQPFALPIVLLPLLAAFAWLWSQRPTAKVAWGAGFGYFLVTLHWIVFPFMVDPARDGWMAPFALVLLPAGLALFWAVPLGLLGRFRSGPMVWALGLCLGEWGRAHLFTGFPWAGFGQAYLDTLITPVIGWIGAEALGYLTIFLAGSVIFLRRWPLGLIALAALPYTPLPLSEPDAPVLRLVQPNAPQAEKWDPDKIGIFERRLMSATAAEGDPAAIIWPETAVPYLLEQSGFIFDEASEAANGAPVVIGINRGSLNTYYNSLVVIERGARQGAIYDKRHLVPFGEYVPFGELLARFGIHGLATSEGGGFTAGTTEAVINMPDIGPTLALICYEGIFPHLSNATERPRLLLLITNDAWFGNWAGPRQHFAQSRLRAIEQGIPLARVANTGITAMIDGAGTVTATIPPQVDGFVDAHLPPASNSTGYRRFGELPVNLFLLFTAVAAILTGRKR